MLRCSSRGGYSFPKSVISVPKVNYKVQIFKKSTWNGSTNKAVKTVHSLVQYRNFSEDVSKANGEKKEVK